MHLKPFPVAIFAVVSAAACLGVDSPTTPADTTAHVSAKGRVKHVAASDDSSGGARICRGALAGPASKPADGSSSDMQDRTPGQGLFRLMDRNKDNKLQPEEIERVLNIFKAAHEASKNGDLTPEEFSKFVEQLRVHGKPLKAKGKLNKS